MPAAPSRCREQGTSRPAAMKTAASICRSLHSPPGPASVPASLKCRCPAEARRVEAAIAQLKQQLPEVQVQPVRQLVEGESRIVDRTHALMYGAVLLIALTVAVSVLATLSASVLERRRDFALMKALGGSQMQLMAMFLLEALVLALAGVAAGFLVGSAAAWVISEGNFHTATLPHLSVLPAGIARQPHHRNARGPAAPARPARTPTRRTPQGRMTRRMRRWKL